MIAPAVHTAWDEGFIRNTRVLGNDSTHIAIGSCRLFKGDSMTQIDLAHLQQWIGKEQKDRDLLSARHARLMAATVGISNEKLVDGAPLPPLWHWIYFLEGLPSQSLGRDGHPARGGFLPPVPLENRMWAGGRLEFHQPLRIGSVVDKTSKVVSIDHKQGRSGDLVFVSVLHELRSEGKLAITEIHDIVYKKPSHPGQREKLPVQEAASHTRPFKPDSTTLFRYSALTFNGHRIHYDADYCREVEGYPNLVIHGPLHATLLANYAEEVSESSLKHFEYRGLQPSYLGEHLSINARHEGEELSLWTALADGQPAMRAKASF